MPVTYEPIFTTTVTSTPTSITFDSIPGIYTDLRIICTPVNSVASNYPIVRFNNDSSSVYAFNEIYGNGTNALAYNSPKGTTYVPLSFYTTFGTSFNSAPIQTMDIMSYANTSVFKSTITRSNATADPNYPGMELVVGLWRSTSAITRVDLILTAGTFTSGTVATLYGIKAA